MFSIFPMEVPDAAAAKALAEVVELHQSVDLLQLFAMFYPLRCQPHSALSCRPTVDSSFSVVD
jgi:hypothetical protein